MWVLSKHYFVPFSSKLAYAKGAFGIYSLPWFLSSEKSTVDGISGCFAGLGYLSLYLAGKLSLFDRRGYSSRVFFVLVPQLATVLIAVSRVNDYKHRWVDIIGASVLGEALSINFKLLYFLPL